MIVEESVNGLVSPVSWQDGMRKLLKLAFGILALILGPVAYAATCPNPNGRMLEADVVALDMPLMFNRLGAQNVNGMMYALKRDVVSLKDEDGVPGPDFTPLTQVGGAIGSYAGNVTLRPDKRPRPLVLRMGAGDCMTIRLTNLLDPLANPFQLENLNPDGSQIFRSNVQFRVFNDNQVAPRNVSLRFQGTELVDGITDDGTVVGNNPQSAEDILATPGGPTKTYTIYAPNDGAFVGVSYGGVVGGEGLGGTTASGLWAVLNVNPPGATFYRSQVTNEELALATKKTVDGDPIYTDDGHPVIDYEALYPPGEPWASEGKAGLPILNMVQEIGGAFRFVHTAIDAIIAYDGDTKDFQMEATGGDYLGHFPPDIYPLESVGHRNPTVPNRLEPFRELTVAFHDETQTTQAFPRWFNDPVFQHTLHGVKDAFMINYGSGGIGSEIIANRLGVGPMHDCVNCAYEEFFLTFHAVGEVGQLVDIPANVGLEQCDPQLNDCEAVGPKASYVLYPADPSNVHHAYTGDATAFRNVHIGPGEQHVFHLHNHQWLFNADDDNSNYLDAQGLGPGSGYGYWVNFGGAGNRNKTAGDTIFHCHFYPHFAQGMWEMWRIHDAFEPGTELVAQQLTVDSDQDTIPDRRASFVEDGLGIGNGTPAPGARALPDGEIVAGAPTPAVIPLPGRPMAPMPAMAYTVPNPNTVDLCVNDGLQVRPDAAGACPAGFTKEARNVGSLVRVPRTLADALQAGLSEGFSVPEDAKFAYGTNGDFGYYYDESTQEFVTDDVSPGYPFWIAGMEHTVGNRPTTPPLDMISPAEVGQLDESNPLWAHAAWGSAAIDGWNGGLPRFAIEGYSAGGESHIALSRLDLSKEFVAAKPVFFPEEGTDLEQIAMGFHAERCHDSSRLEKNADGYESADCLQDPDSAPVAVGLSGTKTHHGFITNGSLPIAGAPFQDPCIDDRGVVMGTQDGWFYDGGPGSGGPVPSIWDTSAMGTRGHSPYTGASPRIYKGANVQFDAVFNKLGYHFPQQRIITLWHDVVPTIRQERPPEPFVMRLNTFDCAQYIHANVVPKAYELDDYQVRTPTDVIGQHIHLPKWDLTSADGSANGWNYEDGTLSPEAVVEMIEAINHWNHSLPESERVWQAFTGGYPDNDPALRPVVAHSDSGGLRVLSETDTDLEAVPHPFFGQFGEYQEQWLGARSTMQRWFADPVVNVQGTDRGLGIIFTHDHYGPSTHQQVGLYATLLIEPAGSKWVHNETGTPLYDGRDDGGPTSWQAAILTGEDTRYNMAGVRADQIESHREFYLEYSDFQHAYQPGVYVGVGPDGERIGGPYQGQINVAPDGLNNGAPIAGTETFRHAIQPPYRLEESLPAELLTNADINGFPVNIWEFPTTCLGGDPRPCPEAITANDPGMYVVNYRNEPLSARIYDPNKVAPDTRLGAQADGRAGDLAFAMSSKVQRAIPELNTVMGRAPAGYFDGVCSGGIFCPPITSVDSLRSGDPFTPMARTYDGNQVHVKVQAGGQEEEFGTTIHGLKWLQAGSGFGESKNSGWRNAQAGGISEQFTLTMPVFADFQQRGRTADYAYSINPSVDGWVSGTWGIIRSYKPNPSGDLYPLPTELPEEPTIANATSFSGVCPIDAPVRTYNLTAVSVNDVLPTPDTAEIRIDDLFPAAHVGASPDAAGGTFVYNTRQDSVDAGGAHALETNPLFRGPLHDPTGIIYVETQDLVAKRPGYTYSYDQKGRRIRVPLDPYCWEQNTKNGRWSYEPTLPSCEVMLAPGVTLEPIVIRANAGDCIEIELDNKVLQQAYVNLSPEGAVLTEDDGYQFGQDALVFGWNANKLKFDAVFEYPDMVGDEEAELDPTQLYLDMNHNGVIDGEVVGNTFVAGADGGPIDLSLIAFDQTMDLANGNAIGAIVRRDPGAGIEGMTSFNNNLMQPSAHVGMRPQLVEYDVSRSDGFNVGENRKQTAAPGDTVNYQWYAGALELAAARGKRFELSATPIEFGGFNILSADPIEQGQKGLVAAGVIYPKGSTWRVDPGRRTAATVYDSAGQLLFRDFTVVATKGLSMSYADSFPVENILGEGEFGIAEDSQDMGHMAINLGNEAMWFRFGTNPTEAAGNADCNGAPGTCLGGIGDDPSNYAFHNSLVGSDPETAVFPVKPGHGFRMHVLMPFAPGRGSTFDLHGHTWQRDPYVCKDEYGTPDWDLGLEGKCDMGLDGLPGSGSVGSQALGENPQGFHLGGIESWFAGEHYEIVIPSLDEGQGAGGSNSVAGDYLFRDHMGLGNTGGLWGILRVDDAAPYEDTAP